MYVQCVWGVSVRGLGGCAPWCPPPPYYSRLSLFAKDFPPRVCYCVGMSSPTPSLATKLTAFVTAVAGLVTAFALFSSAQGGDEPPSDGFVVCELWEDADGVFEVCE